MGETKGTKKGAGTVVWDAEKKRWVGRITLNDGARPWIDAKPGLPHNERGESLAREYIAERAEIARNENLTGEHFLIVRRAKKTDGGITVAPEETCAQWFVRYCDVFEARGKRVRDLRNAWRPWIGPVLDSIPIAKVTREKIVEVRDSLTKATHATGLDRIRAKSCMNVWGILVSAFGRAFSDDDPIFKDVRVGPANQNPALGIKPPVTTEERKNDRRERQWLYPREFWRLMTSDEVDVEWKRLFAIAAYLFLRPEEIYGVRWSDVDFDACEIRIRHTLDLREGTVKETTKSRAGRREVPIHANLLPLLMQMKEEATADIEHARAFGLPSPFAFSLSSATRDVEKNAAKTQACLRRAGIEREELFEGTAHLMPFDFRSWRTTGITWHAMNGTDSYVLAKWSGHEKPDTTWANYAKEGPDKRRRYGEPFPALPEEVIRGAGNASARSSGFPIYTKTLCEGRDLNPHGVTR